MMNRKALLMELENQGKKEHQKNDSNVNIVEIIKKLR